MSKLALYGGTPVIKPEELPKDLFHWPIVTDEDISAVTEVLKAGTMSGNEIAKEFEKEYKTIFNKDVKIELYTPKVKEIVIPNPQRKVKKRPLFTFLDEEDK